MTGKSGLQDDQIETVLLRVLRLEHLATHRDQVAGKREQEAWCD